MKRTEYIREYMKRPGKRQRASEVSLAAYHALTTEEKAIRAAKEREYYQRNKERICARRRAHKAKDRERWNAQAREYMRENKDRYYEYNAANRFGVPRAAIQAHVATSSVCEICGDPPAAKKRLAIDHCHATGVLRGMLCHACNLGLGAFKDDVLRIHKAALYLAKHKAKGDVA